MRALQTSIDVWVASASVTADGTIRPYLIPVSLAWIDDRVVIAIGSGSRTARNLHAAGTTRLAVGPTRDVVIIDAQLEHSEPVHAATGLADRYAERADWDPRETDGDYSFFVLRPQRLDAWRESNEMVGRTLMRQGEWLR
ncbi:MAG: pyridoxamine 5'-phosphate oxidase family protein [Acidimicrobiales bacterium]